VVGGGWERRGEGGGRTSSRVRERKREREAATRAIKA
jgi:hypothetical protein